MRMLFIALCITAMMQKHNVRKEMTTIVRKADMEYGHLAKSKNFDKYVQMIKQEYLKRGLEIKERGESAVMANKVNEYYRNDSNLARHVLKSS